MVKCSYEQKPFRREVMRTYGATVTPSPSLTTEVGRKILADHPDTTGSLGCAISDAVLLSQFVEDIDKGDDAKTDPNGEGVERASVTVVTLTGLLWGLVEVNDNGQSSHKEEEENDPTLLPVFGEQPDETDEAKNQG